MALQLKLIHHNKKKGVATPSLEISDLATDKINSITYVCNIVKTELESHLFWSVLLFVQVVKCIQYDLVGLRSALLNNSNKKVLQMLWMFQYRFQKKLHKKLIGTVKKISYQFQNGAVSDFLMWKGIAWFLCSVHAGM